MQRQSGILMPVFSLNGRYGAGDFGPKAYEFVDKLQIKWQGFSYLISHFEKPN